MIKSIIAWWNWRNIPHKDLAETHTLIVLAARRCAYDLKHAAAQIDENHYDVNFEERADMWLDIFSPDDYGKSYRHKLHSDITELKHEISRYRTILKENGIDDPYMDDIPF